MRTEKLTTLNFNLRGGASDNKVIYAVIYDGREQRKISIGEKVFAPLWDAKRQICKVSSILTEQANNEQMRINKKINGIRFVFEENFLYICANQMEQKIREYINNDTMANEKNLIGGRKYSAKKAINDALKVYVSQEMVKPSSAKIFEYMVKQFCAYIDNGRDSLNHLKEDGLYKYRDYLANEVSRDRANKVISTLQIIINKVIATHPNFKKYGLKSVHIEKLKQPKRTEEEKGKISLTDAEFNAFKSVELDNDTDKRYRDLFVLQNLIGCRISDLQKIVNKEYSITDGYMVYVSQKIDKKTYNAKIKKIAEKANLNREIEVIDTKGNKTIKPIYKILTNHIARHTFITKNIKEKSADDLKYESGHTNTQYINTVYTHLSIKDKINILEKNRENSPKNTPSNEIEDLKRAYSYLGGDFAEVADITDIAELWEYIRTKENELIQMGGDIRTIKRLYNEENKTLKEKKDILKNIIEAIANN